MTVGLAATTYADKCLNVLKNTAFSGISTCYAQLHTSAGEPGAAGTSNVSGINTRKAITWGTTSGGSLSATSVAAWSWSGTSETIRHVSVWDSVGPTGGNFLFSVTFAADKTVVSGDTLTITTLSLSFTPIAT